MKQLKEKPKTEVVKTGIPTAVVLFETMSKELTKSDLPKGVTQCTPKLIKFTHVGQCVHGLYRGKVQQVSSYDVDKRYSFHEIQLASGMMIGFCGSLQLDKALANVVPNKQDVHIIFVEEKPLTGDKAVKLFQVFTREHKFEDTDDKVKGSSESIPF